METIKKYPKVVGSATVSIMDMDLDLLIMDDGKTYFENEEVKKLIAGVTESLKKELLKLEGTSK